MIKSDLKILLDIVKRRISNGASIEDIENFIITNHNEDIFLELKDEIEKYIAQKQKRNQKNQSYWMLICNPSLWGDCYAFEVNEILKNLHLQKDGEWWKINDKTNMELQMKIGEKGIIKVSEDTRTIQERTDYNNEKVVEKLEAGIYGIFEITPDENGKHIYKNEFDEWFVHIKMIDNFFNDSINISKNISQEILGQEIYNSRPSRKIKKEIFDEVLKYISTKKGVNYKELQ